MLYFVWICFAFCSALFLHLFCILFAFVLHLFLHFVRKTKTDDYVARTAPNELNFSDFRRERRGEADSGLRLASTFDVYTYLQKLRHFN